MPHGRVPSLVSFVHGRFTRENLSGVKQVAILTHRIDLLKEIVGAFVGAIFPVTDTTIQGQTLWQRGGGGGRKEEPRRF